MKVLVVSHACVVPVNQEVYVEFERHGWDVALVVPAHWSHAYAAGDFEPTIHSDFSGEVRKLPVAVSGRPQRHFYRCDVSKVLEELGPDVVLIEEEAFSVAGTQWAHAARRRGIPYGMQIAENLPHRVPRWAHPLCRLNLSRASYVLARSPAASALAQRLGAQREADVWPHVVPAWSVEQPARSAEPARGQRRTIGYAGRLVPEKGIDVLLQAHALLPEDITLVVAGDGPLRAAVEERGRAGGRIELSTPAHADMPEFYRRIDLLVLPSRTTPTWSEQFGRVLVEAMWFGVPVVAADSGEIPWVVATTQGGLLAREGDPVDLAAKILTLLDDDDLYGSAAAHGAQAVRRSFSVSGGAAALAEILQRVVRPR